MRKPDGSTIFLGSSVAVAVSVVLYLTFFYQNGHAGSEPDREESILIVRALAAFGPTGDTQVQLG